MLFRLGRRIFRRLSNLHLQCVLYRRITMEAKCATYGSWLSPITSKSVSEKSVSLQEVRTDSENPDTVYWTELRFDEGGRYVVCSKTLGRDDVESLTPQEYSSRTTVHEYGGGAFFVYDGTIYFSNFKDQRMYAQKPTSEPQPITPADKMWRYADAHLNSKTGKIYCVREDHSGIESGATKEAVNVIISLDPVTQEQTILASGADFYSHPRVSPDGNKISWIQWNHPNMPWDTTELWIADMNSSKNGVVDGTLKQLAGGNDVSVVEPGWTADNQLLFVSDKSDWWNLYHVTSTGEHVNVLSKKDKEIAGAHWQFNSSTYAVDPNNSNHVVAIIGGELTELNLETKEFKTITTGFTTHRFANLTSSGDIYCFAGSPEKFPCIIRVDASTKEVKILRESKSLSLDKGYFSIPQKVKWNTSDGDESYGNYYPPKNKDFVGVEGTLPPLLVKAHGGPTSASSDILNLGIQFFTSRGIAVLDVDYRGSTGYGRIYRQKLRQKWGIYDVDDCCHGAMDLANKGKVDKDKLCIDGGSAGGYTTLACLTFKDTFKAGASHYGICDLEVLATDTHKFESRYLDSVIGPYSGDDKKVYEERSPIHFVENLKCPMAFFQGDEDKIVPPNQAQMMYDAVKKKGLKTMFVLFKGEQHGFRQSKNIEAALEGELFFFSKVFGFEAADIDCKIPIENM